jgi:protein-L-isoaspartate(D-aspartate) O-methyltransferase
MSDLSKYYWTGFGSAPIEDVEADMRQGGVKDERVIRTALLFHPGDFRPWEILPRPAIVAGIAEALQPTEDSHVLDIGTGTGYLAAVLASLSKRVISFEIDSTLGAIARRTLDDLPCGSKITVIEGDGSEGHREGAPYDCISVHGRVRQVPPELKEQLADGGRLLLGLGSKDKQELQLITRHGSSFSTKVLGNGGFSALRGRYGIDKASKVRRQK